MILESVNPSFEMANSSDSGGFLKLALPSPPPSISSAAGPALPHTRSRALPPGSSKERAFVDFIESRLLDISGRVESRIPTDVYELNLSPGDPSQGYQSFNGVGKDLEGIIDALWVSATRSSPAFVRLMDAMLNRC